MPRPHWLGFDRISVFKSAKKAGNFQTTKLFGKNGFRENQAIDSGRILKGFGMKAKCPKCENQNQKTIYLLALLGKDKIPLGKCEDCGYEGFLIKTNNRKLIC